jgi:alkylated DNA repair dioxygenase AlkB
MAAPRLRPTPLPEGFEYRPDLIDPDEEQALVAEFLALPFQEFDFHGYLGKRRVVSFGWRYDFTSGLERADPMPKFLWPVRAKAAAFAGIEPDDLEHVLLTEYREGAPIGWHRDRSVFGDVIGISLLSACIFRFRRKRGTAWERVSFIAAPRSAYILRGPSRSEWQHSIPPMERLRYSITFRTLKQYNVIESERSERSNPAARKDSGSLRR